MMMMGAFYSKIPKVLCYREAAAISGVLFLLLHKDTAFSIIKMKVTCCVWNWVRLNKRSRIHYTCIKIYPSL